MNRNTSPVVVLALLAAACPPPDDDDDGDRQIEPACTEPTPVTCRDEIFVYLEMNLSEVSTGEIQNEANGDGFISTVDATAGGFPADGPFVYARFTDTGLEKVDLLDDASLDSMDWDIAFRRFVIRLNSGDGGPSCVTAARTPPNTVFAELTAVSDDLTFNKEDFVTPPDSCELVPDGSGLGTSPGVVLQNYWTYASCLQMTHNVYVIERADGRHVKLEVLSYYAPAAQQECDETGSNDATGSANIRLQWAFLD